MKTSELEHKRRRRKGKCRSVCALRIPIVGICLWHKRRCKRKKR